MKTKKLIFTSFILFVFLFSLLDNSYSQQHWRKICRPTNKDLYKCSFVDTLNGWAIGDSGTIIHTSNGGYNWVLQNSKLKDYMRSVFFLNKNLGWALAWKVNSTYDGTYILRTTNGGTVWDTTKFPNGNTYFNNVFFLDSLTGFLGASSPNSIYKTTNSGINWFICSVDTSSYYSQMPVTRIRFLNNNTGFAVGGAFDLAGVIWKTTNSGQFWSVANVATEPVVDVKFFDSQNHLALGGDYEYGVYTLRTSNGGINWSSNYLGIYGIPTALSFRTNTEGWVSMGTSSKFIMTSNSGESWVEKNTPYNLGVNDIVFKSERFGIGVCIGGYIVKYFSCPTFSVTGNVKYQDNNEVVTSGSVKAMRYDVNTGQIIVYDSADIQSNGYYILNNVPQDDIYIGAVPNSTPPVDYVLTYYPSSIYWQNAVVLNPNGNLTDINIRVFRLLSTTSSHSIKGKIYANLLSPYFPLNDANIYAKSGDSFVGFARSGLNGVYGLNSMPLGNLKIIVNRIGYGSDSSSVNVVNGNIDSVNFYLTKVSIGITPISNVTPNEYKLYQNYPNPFNPNTILRFQIKDLKFVTLKVYNILGKDVATLVNEKLKPGEYEVTFNGSGLASGIYFYKLIAGDFVQTKKMLMIK